MLSIILLKNGVEKMTVNSKLIKYSASCSLFGDWAIKNKLKVSKSNTPKRGDLIMFDFNHNGTSDHVGFVLSAKGNTIYTVEGNTSLTSNDNGGCVMKRTRNKSQVGYFVRPKYTDDITAEMVIQTALAEVGTKEKPKGSNKVKYNTWYYQKAVSGDAYPWCMVYVSWVFAHVNTDTKNTTTSTKKAYTGSYPNLSNVSRKYLKKGDKGKEVTKWQKFLNWAGYNCGKADGVFGDKTVGATKSFQYKNGLTADGFVGAKTISKAKETKK